MPVKPDPMPSSIPTAMSIMIKPSSNPNTRQIAFSWKFRLFGIEAKTSQIFQLI
jgi:hypothetical protein